MNRLPYFKPTLSQSIVIALLLLAGSLIFGILMSLVKLVVPTPMPECQSLAYIVMMSAPFIYIYLKAGKARDAGEPFGKINERRFGSIGSAVWLALSTAALLSLSVLIEPATAFIPMSDGFKALFEKVFYESPLWDSILSTCILAPLCEEFLCRGMMLRGMLATETPRRAIVWSALLFALMHLNPWQSIPAFAIGLLFGWVYYRTGSLWLTIALHCINNSISTLLSRLIPDMGVDKGFIDLMPAVWYIVLYLFCLILFIFAVRFLSKTKDEKTLSA